MIIEDILDFSKIEAGAMRLETINLDLRSTVEDVTVLLGGRAQDKGLELASLVEHDVPEALRGDPGRLCVKFLRTCSPTPSNSPTRGR
jgi:signal transduction histidine kinase